MEKVVARATIFQGVDRTVVVSLIERLQPAEFLAKSPVFAEGDRGDRLYFIASGKVKISRCSPGGRDLILAVLGPSDMFGLQSVLDPGPRTSNAVTISALQACWADRATVRGWIAEHPTITEQLLRVLARRLRRADHSLADLTFSDTARRVTKQLLRLARGFGIRQHDAIHVLHDLTPDELAHLAGASLTATHRALAELAGHGWIQLQDRRIVITDFASLTDQTLGRCNSDSTSC